MCMGDVFEYLRQHKGWHSIADVATGTGKRRAANHSVTRSLRAIMFYGDIYAKTDYPLEGCVKHRQLFCHERWIR